MEILKPKPGLFPVWNNNPMAIPPPVDVLLMNEGSGDKTFDLSENGRNALFQNTPTWDSNGVLFDASTEHLQGANGAFLQSQGTIVFGYRQTNVPGSFYYWVVLDDDYSEFSFLVDVATSRIDFYINSDSPTWNNDCTWIDGNYHNVAVTWDADANLRKIYDDGVLFEASTDVFTWDAAGMADHDLRVGGRVASNDRYAGGIIFYFYVYNHVLTPAQIAYLHMYPYYAWEYPELWEYYAGIPAEGPTMPVFGYYYNQSRL